MAYHVKVTGNTMQVRSLGSSDPVQHGWWVISLLLFAGLIRIYALSRGFNEDEIFTVLLVRMDLRPLVYATIHSDNHPPLYYLFMHYWQLMGDNEAFLRIPSVVSGLLTCWFAYLSAKYALSERSSVAVLALVATTPGLVWASQVTRNYSFMFMFAAAATYCLLQALTARHRAYWWYYLVCTVAGLYTFYYYAVFYLALALAVLLCWKWTRKAIGIFAVVQAVGGLLFLPWVPYIRIQMAHIPANEVLAQKSLHVGDLIGKATYIVGALNPFGPGFRGVSSVFLVCSLSLAVALMVIAVWHFSRLRCNPVARGTDTNRLAASARAAAVLGFLLLLYSIAVYRGAIDPFWHFSSLLSATGILLLFTSRAYRLDSSEEELPEQRLAIVLLLILVIGSLSIVYLVNATTGMYAYVHYLSFISIFAPVLLVYIVAQYPRGWLPAITIVLCICNLVGTAYKYRHAQEDYKQLAGYLMAVARHDYVGVMAASRTTSLRYYLPSSQRVHGIRQEVESGRLVCGNGEAAVDSELKRQGRIRMVWSHTHREGVDRGEAALRRWLTENGYVTVHSRQFPGDGDTRIELFVRSRTSGAQNQP